MGEMLALSPEGIEKEIHPHALRRYEEWKADIRREIPLDELNGDDLNACLLQLLQTVKISRTKGLRYCSIVADDILSVGESSVYIANKQSNLCMIIHGLSLGQMVITKEKTPYLTIS